MTDPQLAAVLDDVRAGLDEAAGYVDAICRTVELVLAGSGAAADVTALRRSFTGVTTHVTGLLLTAGDPQALRAAGTAWVDDVGRPVSALVGVATDDVLETDDHWTGAAADSYRATLPAQRLALAAIVTTCQEVDTVFEDLAVAITRFWIAIGSACLGLVLALAAALGSAATVVGATATPGIALAGVGALVVAGTAALSSLTEVTAAAATRHGAVARRLGDSSAFPLGRWPRSTTGISTDARVTDGDGSDWRPR